MPGFSDDSYEKLRVKRAKEVTAKLVAKGLNPRSLGFSRAFHKLMRK